MISQSYVNTRSFWPSRYALCQRFKTELNYVSVKPWPCLSVAAVGVAYAQLAGFRPEVTAQMSSDVRYREHFIRY